MPDRAALDPGQPHTVVILDLDGTVIPDQEAFRDAAEAVLAIHLPRRKPVEPAADQVGELLVRARRAWVASPLRETPAALGVSSWEAMWSDLDHQDPSSPPIATGHAVSVWHDTLTALGGDPRQARSAAGMLIARREALTRPFPGALETVKRLAAGNRVWLVTHGSSSLQRRKVHLASLDPYLERIFISAEVGHLKTSTEFGDLLRNQLQRSGLRVRAVIGDGGSDLALAAQRGWPAIHICSRWPCSSGDPSVRHRRTFAECFTLTD
jgi:FMN phosphatase YigB (HAD superfamily)